MSAITLRQHGERTRNGLIVVAWALAIWLAWILDHSIWSWATIGTSVEGKDWWRLLRIVGYLPTWIVVAAIVGAAVRWRGRAWLACICGLLSGATNGLLAEIIKRVVARERPGATGYHNYRGIFSGFANDGDLGLPSSHAAVAFGAAFAIALVLPRAAWPVLLLAAGCGVSRVVHGAHFTSDVIVAAACGHLCSRFIVGVLDRGARGIER